MLVNSNPHTLPLEPSHRNALVPLSKLPPGIVVNIMLIYRDELFQVVFQRARWYRFICITHIYRRWRYIALDAPILWSILYIPPINPIWQRRLLNRTKEIPLEIVYIRLEPFEFTGTNLDGNKRHKSLSIFFSEGMKKTKKLVLSATEDDKWGDQRVLEYAILGAAPILESLSLEGHEGSLQIPKELFSKNTPALQHLSLTSCSFSWESFLFNHKLLTLAISRPASRPTWAQLGQILGYMDGLQKLSLVNALPTADDQTPLLSLSVLPATIDTLELDDEDESTSIDTVISRLSLSSLARLQLCIVDKGSVSVYLQVLKTLISHYSKVPPKFDPQISLALTVSAARHGTIVSLEPENGRSVFVLNAFHNWGQYYDPPLDTVLSFIQLFRPGCIKKIKVSTGPSSIANQIRKIYPQAEFSWEQ